MSRTGVCEGVRACAHPSGAPLLCEVSDGFREGFQARQALHALHAFKVTLAGCAFERMVAFEQLTLALAGVVAPQTLLLTAVARVVA